VHLLLEEYKKLSKVVGKLGKTNLGKGSLFSLKIKKKEMK